MSAIVPPQPFLPAIRRLCVAVDIESYSSRTIPAQIDLQTRLLWVLTEACRVSGVKPARCDRQDSGDGQILVLPPGIDEAKVLPGLVLGILTAVRRANEAVGPGGRMRLRISFGQGAIQIGQMGFGSQAVITVARLLDSSQLRADLAAEPAAEGAVVVTDDLYRDMFSQGYGGLDPSGFRDILIDIPAKRFIATAWVQVPVDPPLLLKVSMFPDLADVARRQSRTRDITVAAAAAWAVFVTAEIVLDDIVEAANEIDGSHEGSDHGNADGNHASGHDSYADVDYDSPHPSTLHPTDDITPGDSDHEQYHDDQGHYQSHDPAAHDAGHGSGIETLQENGHNVLGEGNGGPGSFSEYSLGYEVLAVDADYGYDANPYLSGDAAHYDVDHDLLEQESSDHAGDHGHGDLDLTGSDHTQI